MKIIALFVAGGLGTLARFFMQTWANHWGTYLPYGTLLVNAIGSFFISFVVGISVSSPGMLSPLLQATLTVGFLGGFTTYSSFNNETLLYFTQGYFMRGMINVFLMFLVCMIFGVLGLILAKRLSVLL